MAYPSRAALVAASTVTELTGLTTGEQDALRAASIRLIEEYTGQSFEETDETRTLDGTGGRVLPLPWRLAELTTLTVTGSSIDASDVAISQNGDKLTVRADWSSTWAEKAIREDQPPVFVSGPGTVEIEGIWGWLDADLPAADVNTAIAIALRKDMEDSAIADANPLADTARAMAKLRQTEVNEGPLSIVVDPRLVPISAEVKQLLRPYIWHPVGRAVV